MPTTTKRKTKTFLVTVPVTFNALTLRDTTAATMRLATKDGAWHGEPGVQIKLLPKPSGRFNHMANAFTTPQALAAEEKRALDMLATIAAIRAES